MSLLFCLASGSFAGDDFLELLKSLCLVGDEEEEDGGDGVFGGEGDFLKVEEEDAIATPPALRTDTLAVVNLLLFFSEAPLDEEDAEALWNALAKVLGGDSPFFAAGGLLSSFEDDEVRALMTEGDCTCSGCGLEDRGRPPFW